MGRAPIDDATLLILRPLLRDLEAGRVVVTSLQAGDDEHRALAVSWCDAKGDPVPAAGDIARVAEALAGKCPDCGASTVDLTDALVCTKCGYDSTAQA